MFTGIVEEVGTIDTISRGANSAVLTIRAEKVACKCAKRSTCQFGACDGSRW